MSNYTYEELQDLVARQQEEIDRLKGGSGPHSAGLDTPLSARVTALREARGMTKAELARRMGVSDVLIGSIENGTIKQVGHLRLTAMARAFGLTVSELLGDTPNGRLVVKTLVRRVKEAGENENVDKKVLDHIARSRESCSSEHDGYAQEVAMAYGFTYLDDDCETMGVTVGRLGDLMAVLRIRAGVPTASSS